MKSLYKSLTVWLLCLVFVFSNFIVSFADVKSLMIGSSSNALMTLELDDSDYLMKSPRSSIGTVTNTLSVDKIQVRLGCKNFDTGATYSKHVSAVLSNGRYRFSDSVLDGYRIVTIDFYIAYPSSGTYEFSFDYSSDFAYSPDVNDSYWSFKIWYRKNYKNASSVTGSIPLSFTQYSGDVYVAPTVINLTNVDELTLPLDVNYDDGSKYAGGSFAVNFKKVNSNPSAPSTGIDTSEQEFNENMSQSFEDLSSSVDSMTEDLSSAAENLEYISTSQNLIIQGIDNVVMHISDQLFAFWNQLFNLIHVPTMAKMDDIISAIQNMDLEIEVNLDGLKSTINNMSTAVQNKLQSTTDKITSGYDNSGITQENEKLEQSINQYDEVESGIFEDAEGFIGDFEYPSVESLPLGIIKALAFVGSFLQGVFLCMGEFSVIITFSLTMIFVMVVVGYHRIRS